MGISQSSSRTKSYFNCFYSHPVICREMMDNLWFRTWIDGKEEKATHSCMTRYRWDILSKMSSSETMFGCLILEEIYDRNLTETSQISPQVGQQMYLWWTDHMKKSLLSHFYRKQNWKSNYVTQKIHKS